MTVPQTPGNLSACSKIYLPRLISSPSTRGPEAHINVPAITRSTGLQKSSMMRVIPHRSGYPAAGISWQRAVSLNLKAQSNAHQKSTQLRSQFRIISDHGLGILFGTLIPIYRLLHSKLFMQIGHVPLSLASLLFLAYFARSKSN